jgi:hypothetical protein
LAYWKARRLPISPVPGTTAIVRRVKSSAPITPPKTYYYQNPNQPETKTQPRKMQTTIKWKKQAAAAAEMLDCWTLFYKIWSDLLSNTKQDFIAATGGATTEVPCEAWRC